MRGGNKIIKRVKVSKWTLRDTEDGGEQMTDDECMESECLWSTRGMDQGPINDNTHTSEVKVEECMPGV